MKESTRGPHVKESTRGPHVKECTRGCLLMVMRQLSGPACTSPCWESPWPWFGLLVVTSISTLLTMYCMYKKSHAAILNCFTHGNEAVTWPRMHRTVHSYANRLYVVPCLRWKGRGYVKFHYNTFLEHIYPYASNSSPQNTNLVSAIYWSHQCEFSTMELQHRAKPSQTSS